MSPILICIDPKLFRTTYCLTENYTKVLHLEGFLVVFHGRFFFLWAVMEKETPADSQNEAAEPHGPRGSSYLTSK